MGGAQKERESMSEFSEAIKAEIKKSGQTLLYLSDASGLSLDHISKMRQGKRLPQDTEKVRKLIMALQCSEDVSKTLFSLYKIERMGNEEWNCMQEIKKMLEYRTGFLDIAQLDIQVEKGDWEALQDIHVLHSRTEVISFLQRVLSQRWTYTAHVYRRTAGSSGRDTGSVFKSPMTYAVETCFFR